jgi:hypothetical protein
MMSHTTTKSSHELAGELAGLVGQLDQAKAKAEALAEQAGASDGDLYEIESIRDAACALGGLADGLRRQEAEADGHREAGDAPSKEGGNSVGMSKSQMCDRLQQISRELLELTAEAQKLIEAGEFSVAPVELDGIRTGASEIAFAFHSWHRAEIEREVFARHGLTAPRDR